MRTKRAFTLLELTTVIAILLVLASLLAPVLTETKAAAKVAASTGNLRQGYLAIQLYRNDWEETPFGAPAPMGLPPYPGILRETPREVFKSPCSGMNPGFQSSENYIYLGIVGDEEDQRRTSDMVLRYLGTTPLLVDENCNRGVDMSSSETQKRYLWVNLDGSVLRRTTRKTAIEFAFITDQQKG